MAYSFDDAAAASRRTNQYFEILGNRAIYADGWMASCFHGRLPWIRLQGLDFDGPQERWELYNIAEDFSQAVDLAATHPEKLAELQALFHRQAIDYGVYPLRDAGSPRHGEFSVPHVLDGIASMTYTTAHVRMPESVVMNLKNCSWKITAAVDTAQGDRGVIACQGGNMAGWSLYLTPDTRPVFHYNLYGHEHFVFASPTSLEPGRHVITLDFAYDGGFGAGGTLVVAVDGTDVAGGRIDKTVPLVYSMSGETFDIGIDTGSPVGNYPHDYRCTAHIAGVTLERLSDIPADVAERVRQGMFVASLSTQ